jgi:hypothetical protein
MNLISNDSVGTTELNISEVVIMYNPKDLYNALSFVDKINDLVGNVLEKVVEKLGQDFTVGSEQNNQDGQGKYLNYNGKQSMFLGLNPSIYEEQNGDFVFGLDLAKKALNENYKINKEKYTWFSDEEWIYIKIDRKILVDDEQEKVLENIVLDIIKNVFLKNI